MIHPDTELRFINPNLGYGVVATRLIPRGTITWVRDDLDQTLSPSQVERLAPFFRNIVTTYGYIDSKGDYVLCWDLARYINHSCEPSCRMAGYEFEVAVRDVHPGEQLTDEYGYLNIEYDFSCACGSPRCRKQVRAGDLIRYAKVWDQLIEEPFRLIGSVPQPLWHAVRDTSEIQAILANKAPIASCLRHYPLSFATTDVRRQLQKALNESHLH
jgi:hypothetical protein